MAVTVYTGPPGAGKSYALVSQVIVEGVLQGREVKTNVDGVKPDAVLAYCRKKAPGKRLGRVELFHGEDSHKPDFWPTEASIKAGEKRFINPGDLVVFDEWKLYYPKRGKLPVEDVEGFIRWHRHMTNDQGTSCDLVIGTQLPTDIHADFRGIVEASYKFRKLTTVGLDKAYAWRRWDGHLQPKNEGIDGKGTYKAEIFELYKSYQGNGGDERRTDRRGTIWSRGLFVMIGAGFLLCCFAGWALWRFFNPDLPSKNLARSPQQSKSAAPIAMTPPRSPWRIAGTVIADQGFVVVLMNDDGRVRLEPPSGFRFRDDRPMSGTVDGLPVVAEDRAQLRALDGVAGL